MDISVPGRLSRVGMAFLLNASKRVHCWVARDSEKSSRFCSQRVLKHLYMMTPKSLAYRELGSE